MRIAIFHNIMWSKYKGNVFSAVYELAQGEAVDVSFTQIAETEGERVALGGVDLSYHRYPYELLFQGAYSDVPLMKRIAALVTRAMKTEADVVIIPGYERIEYWAMLLALMMRGKPRAVFCDSTAYDRPHHPIKALAKRIFFSACQGFFGYGARSREYLIQHGARIQQVFFRCQAAALPHDYTEAAALQQRELKAPRAGEPPRYLYVGRLAPEKGLFTLLDAFKEVAAHHPRARLALAGAGPLRSQLEAAASQLGLAQNVHFLGGLNIQALSEQYATATALVLPSTSEPWGLVVNEALSYGCPAVVSNACGCVPELVVEGKTGFVFETGDTSDLVNKLLAATSQFVSDPKATAKTTITHMRQFTPAQAAAQILSGCSVIFERHLSKRVKR